MSNVELAKVIEDKENNDSFENLVANLGTNKDKRTHSRFTNSRRLSQDDNQKELSNMYRTDWLAGKVVDIVPDDMTREWRSFTGDITPEQIKQLEDEEDRLELSCTFNEAHKWGRLYGTGFIVISVDDGQTPDMPLDIDKIKKGGLRHIKAIDRHRVSNANVTPVGDPMNANFGMPEFYRFNETSVKIHHSRVLRFDGVKLPYNEFRENNYYSDSVLDRLYEALTNFVTTSNGSATMVYESNVDIVQVKGLMNYIQSPEGESLIRKRFALADMLKSFNNLMLLDSEENFDTKTNSFASLPDLLDRFALFLSGASDIPATRLLGSSASGLNATGEGDLKNYYDTVRSYQKKIYKPKLDYFDKIMAKSLGFGENVDLSYEFNSLFQVTPKQKADTEFVQAQTAAIYMDRGVLDEVIIAKELMQNSTYSNITPEIIAEMETIQGEDEDDGFDADTDEDTDEEQQNPKTEEKEEG